MNIAELLLPQFCDNIHTLSTGGVQVVPWHTPDVYRFYFIIIIIIFLVLHNKNVLQSDWSIPVSQDP